MEQWSEEIVRLSNIRRKQWPASFRYYWLSRVHNVETTLEIMMDSKRGQIALPQRDLERFSHYGSIISLLLSIDTHHHHFMAQTLQKWKTQRGPEISSIKHFFVQKTKKLRAVKKKNIAWSHRTISESWVQKGGRKVCCQVFNKFLVINHAWRTLRHNIGCFVTSEGNGIMERTGKKKQKRVEWEELTLRIEEVLMRRLWNAGNAIMGLKVSFWQNFLNTDQNVPYFLRK